MNDAQHLVYRIAAAWNRHDPAAIAALHAPEGTVADPGLPVAAGAAVIARARTFLDGLEGFHLAVGEVIAETPGIAYEWRVTGTHTGLLLGFPPTGRAVDVSGVSLLELNRDGQILEERLYWDRATLQEQLT
jgi:steroid delta-isomerase-like uncharacterized protein